MKLRKNDADLFGEILILLAYYISTHPHISREQDVLVASVLGSGVELCFEY